MHVYALTGAGSWRIWGEAVKSGYFLSLFKFLCYGHRSLDLASLRRSVLSSEYNLTLSIMSILFLISLLFGHYIGDYTHLSTAKMLAAKRVGSPLLPILEHAMAHTILMSIVFAFFLNDVKFGSGLFFIFLGIELASHFAIDVLKGKCNIWFPQAAYPTNKSHWYIFGFDQFLHQLVIALIWWVAIR